MRVLHNPIHFEHFYLLNAAKGGQKKHFNNCIAETHEGFQSQKLCFVHELWWPILGIFHSNEHKTIHFYEISKTNKKIVGFLGFWIRQKKLSVYLKIKIVGSDTFFVVKKRSESDGFASQKSFIVPRHYLRFYYTLVNSTVLP